LSHSTHARGIQVELRPADDLSTPLRQFHQQPHYPVETVCNYLAEGLSQGEAAVAVVVPEHAESITKELNMRGFRVDEMVADGRFACADITEALTYLLDPKISKHDKHSLSARWVEDTLTRAPSKRCRFLGELVSIMVARGRLESAFELEDSWNQLLAAFPAMLYCIYEQTPFEQLQGLNNFCEVCNHHDAVISAHLRSENSKEPSAWFVLLQEQASALREEVMRRRMAERLVFVNEANRLKQLEALLRVHGPNLSPMEKNDIVKVVTELQAQARKERRHVLPESPEWHKKAGEILGYEKVIASVLRAGREPSHDPPVS
jgi:MEDS: MEthanogen/methylotroph, DcmR Sensory domain